MLEAVALEVSELIGFPKASTPVTVPAVNPNRAAADSAGADEIWAVTSIFWVFAGTVSVIVVFDATPTRAIPGVPAEIAVTKPSPAPAIAGTDESSPKLNADTATSAMRLRSVFVDICFLSISRSRAFPSVGLGNKCPLICHEKTKITRFDESHVLIHQIPHRVSGRGEETYLLVFHLHSLR
jgi:hypothetical protein